MPLTVVLGASGLVGSAVAALLARRRIRLRLVAPRAVARLSGRAGLERVVGDLTSPDCLADAVRGADAVISLVVRNAGSARGWRDGAGDTVGEQVNVGVLRGVLEHADERCPAVVFAGSTTQAGVGGRIDGTELDRPEGGYERHKLAAENELKRATVDGLVRGVSVRLPTVYGCRPDGAERGVAAMMIRKALAGEPLPMWGEGGVRRDLLHVRDAARAFVTALDHADTLAGGHWPVGTGASVPLSELFELISATVASATGRPAVPLVSLPPPEHAAPGDLRDTEVDASRFAVRTGWLPGVPLEPGIRHTVKTVLARAA